MKAGDVVGGKYRLARRLGQGAMGVVWEAVHEMTSRRVAVKLIVNATDNLRRRLLREGREGAPVGDVTGEASNVVALHGDAVGG